MVAAVYQIPEKIVNFNLYNETEKQIGITGEVKLPSLEAMTETISGAGIAGEYESATPGHFSSMEIEIPYRLVGAQALALMSSKYSTLFLRGAKQLSDISGGGIVTKPLKVTLKVSPKGMDLGKVAVGGLMETTGKLEVLYIKVETDDTVILELDKQNFIFVVNGVDQLAQIRGMM